CPLEARLCFSRTPSCSSRSAPISSGSRGGSLPAGSTAASREPADTRVLRHESRWCAWRRAILLGVAAPETGWRRSLEARHRVAPPSQHEAGPAGPLVGLRVLEELVGRGPAQPRREAALLHAAPRDAPLVHAQRVEGDRLPGQVVERGGEAVTLRLDTLDHVRRVVHLHRDPRGPDLQIVAAL